MIQPVNTDAVEAALAGDSFVETSKNYLDQDTLTVAGPLDIKGVQWVGVAEVTTAEAHAPLRRHVITLVLMLLVLIPIVILLAFVIARRLLSPIGPTVDAADRVRHGDLDVDLVIPSHDEFGDLANRFNGVVSTLKLQATKLEQAEVETTELLQAVMPPRLAQQFQSGERDISEALSNATLVVISVDEPEVERAAEREAIADHTVAVSSGIGSLAERYGLEQIASSATEYIAVAGLDVEDDEAGKAVEFAVAVRSWLDQAGVSVGVVIATRIGLASGDVVTGVVGTDRVAFNVWVIPAGGPLRWPRWQAGAKSSSIPPSRPCRSRIGGSVLSSVSLNWTASQSTDGVSSARRETSSPGSRAPRPLRPRSYCRRRDRRQWLRQGPRLEPTRWDGASGTGRAPGHPVAGLVVRAEGLEPPRAFAHQVLNLARLPVPPRPEARNVTVSGATSSESWYDCDRLQPSTPYPGDARSRQAFPTRVHRRILEWVGSVEEKR